MPYLAFIAALAAELAATTARTLRGKLRRYPYLGRTSLVIYL